MKKKLIKTSLSGFEQTLEWLENNKELKKSMHNKNIDNNYKKKFNKRLREATDISKKNILW